MFDVSQTPTPISGAYLVQTSRSSEDRECQEIGRKQAASDTASSHSTLPRIPASVKLPAQSNHTSESLQPSRTYQGNGSAKEQWRPEPSHIDMAENEKEEGGRYHQQVSLQHASTDPEKAYSQQSPEQFYGHSLSRPYHTTIRYEADDMEDESTAEEHSVWILIYLACLTPFLSLLFSLYTLLTITVLLLLQPVCFFCTERKPLSTQIRYFLRPPIAFQLGLIYSKISVGQHSSKKCTGSSSMLVMVNLFGPVYAAWIAASAWVAAGFWAFAAIMGDPDGRDGHGGKDDGRAAVLGVRRWWERWLERAIR